MDSWGPPAAALGGHHIVRGHVVLQLLLHVLVKGAFAREVAHVRGCALKKSAGSCAEQARRSVRTSTVRTR